jgi:hypothetical protein
MRDGTALGWNRRMTRSLRCLTLACSVAAATAGAGCSDASPAAPARPACNKVDPLAPGRLLLGGWHDNFLIGGSPITFQPRPPVEFAHNLARLESYAGRELAWTYVPIYWNEKGFAFPTEHVRAIHERLGGEVVPFLTIDLKTANLPCKATHCFYRGIIDGTYDDLTRAFADEVLAYVNEGGGRRPLMIVIDGETNAGWDGTPDAETYKAAVRKIYRTMREHNGAERVLTWVHWGNTALGSDPEDSYAAWYPEDTSDGITFDYLMVGLHAGYPELWGECVSGVEWLEKGYPKLPGPGLYEQVRAANPRRPILMEADATAYLEGPEPKAMERHCVIDNPDFVASDPSSHPGVAQWITELYGALAAGDFPAVRGVSWWGDGPFESESETWWTNLIHPLDGSDPESARPPVSFDYGGAGQPIVDAYRSAIADGAHFVDGHGVATTDRCELVVD